MAVDLHLLQNIVKLLSECMQRGMHGTHTLAGATSEFAQLPNDPS